MKQVFPSLIFLKAAFAALATFSALTPSAEADTMLTITLSGTFVREYNAPHPDISLGDQFQFSMTFDDSQTSSVGGGSFLEVTSILSSEFLVNGIPHAHTTPTGIGLNADQPWFGPPILPGAFQIINDEGLNNIYVLPMRLSTSPADQRVGPTAEFSDFLRYNGYQSVPNAGDFAVSDPFMIQGLGGTGILGQITNTTVVTVPEPGIVAFAGLAAFGVCLLPRRRK